MPLDMLHSRNLLIQSIDIKQTQSNIRNKKVTFAELSDSLSSDSSKLLPINSGFGIHNPSYDKS